MNCRPIEEGVCSCSINKNDSDQSRYWFRSGAALPCPAFQIPSTASCSGNEVPLVKPEGKCKARGHRRRRCSLLRSEKRLCHPHEQPDPCTCTRHRCQKCPTGTKAIKIGWQSFPGYSMSPRHICIRFNACPVSNSKGLEMKAGSSEMNTGEFMAMISNNTARIAKIENIIKAMQSIFTNKSNDK